MAAFDVNGGVSCRAKSQRDKDFNDGYEQGFAQGVKQASESLANCHQSEIDALKAQVEDLIQDAERYRILRGIGSVCGKPAVVLVKGLYDFQLITGEGIDKYVDKEIAEALQQQKGEECTVQA